MSLIPLLKNFHNSLLYGKGLLFSYLTQPFSRVYYIIEGGEWAIDWVGYYVARNIHKGINIQCLTGRKVNSVIRQIIHFGSRNTCFPSGIRQVHPSNRVILTWFHGNKEDPNSSNQKMIQQLPECASKVEKIVVSATITKKRLIEYGIPESKIILIPLGVDLSIFKPPTSLMKKLNRDKLGIPDNMICIGSFQKDGVGWQEGLQPKLVKGPDLLLEVLRHLQKKYPIFVLLTGPARGYVKAGLEKLKIPYRHVFLKNYPDIVAYYHCLDLYLITSRDEGGPKALLESMATGVPVVSTRVGMAPDIIRDGYNGRLAGVEDIDDFTKTTLSLLENPALRARFIQNGLTTTQSYDWSRIALRYYEEIYKPLLHETA